MRRWAVALALLITAGCANDGKSAVRATTTSSAAPTTSTSPPPATTTAAIVAAPGLTAAQLSASWRPGCPVAPSQLRSLQLEYWGFDGKSHTGTLVVNARVVGAVTRIFAALYGAQFPIRRMEPIDAFGGSDEKSLEADNTSGFNCRRAVASGPARWSVHAYGEAIDVNPVENPYVEGGKIHPAAGADYVKRTPERPGMAVARGPLVTAFASVGWKWGGRWTDTPDYQHFSSTGG